MSITLTQILELVGRLDDTPGEETSRERFRRFLKENIKEVGQIRDYIEECLRSSGDQFDRALQDLVNHLGYFLGFEVTFGRYHGVSNQPEFDGHWKSQTGFHIIIEVKKSEVYPIRTSVLVGYVDELISTNIIPNWDYALGIYVIGRLDPEIRQLENAIIAERRTHQLRIISVESLLSLAEMMTEYDVSHDDILTVLQPSRPTIDLVVDLITRVIVQPPPEGETGGETSPSEEGGEVVYWLTPVKGDEEETADEVIQTLVGEEKIYAFGERTPGRRHVKQKDWICYYATGKGVVAHAKVKSKPEKRPHRRVRHPERYPWVFHLENTRLYLDSPIAIDASLRAKLDTFRGRDANKSWAWFVQATRKISEHDFNILTQHETSE